MSYDIEAFGPYNFIPFPEKVIERYSSVDELPAHDSINPELYTGEIKVKITAETPLFISSGDADKNNPKFFRDPSGRICIPGSSLRGLIRENAQILSLGFVSSKEDLEDYRIYYRNMAKTKSAADKRQQEKYLKIIPETVNAGYLSCENGKYYITPVTGAMLRIPMTAQNRSRFSLLYSLYKKYMCEKDVIYKSRGESITEIEGFKGKVPDGYIKGKLLVPGKPVSNMYSVYVFPPADKSVAKIPISEDDIVAYRTDFESRQTTLGKDGKVFWNIPNGKNFEGWPVFYRADNNGNLSFGRSKYLRITYNKSIADGLPIVHLNLKKQNRQVLDYTRSMFGFVADDVSYKSRVSFENLICTDLDAVEGESEELVLGAPKPSFYAGYIANGNTYDDDSFFLRGYKQYWFKEPYLHKHNASCYIAPMDEGTEFTGTIHYKNLAADELGLLLWALLPIKGYCHGLGKAKPYGYGRINIRLTDLTRLNVKAAYSSATSVNIYESIVNEANTLIDAFKDKASVFYGKPISETETIKSFLYMHKVIMRDNPDEPFDYDYPLLEDFKDIKYPLPTVMQIKQRNEGY